MKCPTCRLPMTAESDAIGTTHTCPDCGRSVTLVDAGYAPTLAPEPPRRPAFKPIPPAVPPADDDPPPLAAERKAALRAAMKDAHARIRKDRAPIQCAWEPCGAWFVPPAGNAKFCQTRSPLCVDRRQTARNEAARRTPRRRMQGGECQPSNA